MKPQMPKFERMQMLPTIKMHNNDSPRLTSFHHNQNNDLSNVWHTENKRIPILNQQCNANLTIVQACRLFEMCVGNFTMLLTEVDEKLLLTKKSSIDMSDAHISLISLNRNWSEFVTINVAFYGGLFLGAMFGAIILFMMKITFDYITTPKSNSNSTQGPSERQYKFSLFVNAFKSFFFVLYFQDILSNQNL